MARVPLVSSAYAGKSIIASGQECVNLYAENNINAGDKQAPVPVTYYPTPGSILKGTTSNNAPIRGEYRTSVGTAYVVSGVNVYYVAPDFTMIQVGSIADNPTQVYFKDNGLAVVLVDGFNGYAIDMASNHFGKIVDPNFYGADFVELIDTFFIFNRPNTNQFYISLSQSTYGMLTSSGVGSGSITAGAGYTNGSYDAVPLTGGSGTGATASIVVAGGVVTVVSIENFGQDYEAGDVLSANAADIGGTGAGFSYTVTGPATAFDPLDIAAKSGFNDPIVGLISVHRELWLIGALTTEVWIGTGAADFYFQEVQGAYINHGCSARYSIAAQDTLTFFLQQDQQGNGLVLQGQGYDVIEISTPRIVEEFKSYQTLADAIGFCFQISDHAFYALVFPVASKGWLYDLNTKEWCEWNWFDVNGVQHRPRANCCMFAFGLIIVGDWENGNIYQLSPDVYTDNGVAIVCIRTFPHMTSDEYSRVSYKSFEADMEVGTIEDLEANPQVFLSSSDDRGRTYGNPIPQSLGQTGQYLTTIAWNRLGMARDRVFKLQWNANMKTALNGGFVDFVKAKT